MEIKLITDNEAGAIIAIGSCMAWLRGESDD
jgi:hypothetical protein